MFVDGRDEVDYKSPGPSMIHFRSQSLADAHFHLQQQWELCCESDIELPAIRYTTAMSHSLMFNKHK